MQGQFGTQCVHWHQLCRGRSIALFAAAHKPTASGFLRGYARADLLPGFGSVSTHLVWCRFVMFCCVVAARIVVRLTWYIRITLH